MGKYIKRLLFRLAIAGGSVYLIYTYALNDEAKESLKSGYQTIMDAYQKIQTTLEDRKGIVIEEDVFPNKRETQKQWAELGF